MAKTKFGIIGSGDVGKALAKGLTAHGYEVLIGTRDAAKLADWKHGKVGSFADAAAFGDAVIVCTKWDGTKSALDLAGPERLKGKLVIDVTNPLDFSHGFPPRLAIGHTDSAGEQVQRWLPGSKVVKCWNIVGNVRMIDPKLEQGTPFMAFCGNDEGARKQVADLLADLGWKDLIDLGGIEQARLLEPLCVLWVHIAAKTQDWGLAFAALRK